MTTELSPKNMRAMSAPLTVRAFSGVGKTISVTTKVDAELRHEITRARTAAGMTESGFIRMALQSYLDSMVHRSIANEISAGAAQVAKAAESVSQPAVIARIAELELNVASQLAGFVRSLEKVLGEPMDLDAEVGSAS